MQVGAWEKTTVGGKVLKTDDTIYLKHDTNGGVLNERGVYCNQESIHSVDGTYEIGSEKTVNTDNDAGLAWLLYQAVINDKGLGTDGRYYYSNYQNAYWKYTSPNNYEFKNISGVANESTVNGLVSTAQNKNESSAIVPKVTLNINGDNLDVTVSGKFTKFDIITNGVKYKSGITKSESANKTISIPLNHFNSSKAIVDIVAYYEYYTATYRELKNDSQQNLIVITKASMENRTKTVTKYQQLSKDISLQKYIIEAKNSNGVYYQNESARSGMLTYEEEKKTAEAFDKPAKDVENVEKYKYNNAVNIDVGDEVTYRIYLYNNETSSVSNVYVKDNLPTGTSVVNITKNGSTLNNYNVSELTDNGKKYNQLTISEIELPAGNSASSSKTAIDITLKFNQELGGIVGNTAWIYTGGDAAKVTGDYRTLDRDYVKMGSYSVSLEKYVSAVNDTPLAELESPYRKEVNTREGHRNCEFEEDKVKDKENNLDTYKKIKTSTTPGPVPVEKGDKVTFTIKLTNTGENPVKVTQIYDSFMYGEEGSIYNGLQLVFDADYGIKGSVEGYNGTIINNHYDNDADNANKELDRYLIEFTNASLINKSESVYITMKFTVIDNNDDYSTLQNKAGIVQIQNLNNVVVNDSDGNENNYDMDWVETSTIKYEVGLEKFVTEVNGVPVQQPSLDPSSNVVSLYDSDGDGNLINEGDINGNGIIDTDDAFVYLNYGAGKYTDQEQAKKKDLNGDGLIDAIDGMIALNFTSQRERTSLTGAVKNDDKDKYKNENPVLVEPGDEVTFRIKLTNTADWRDENYGNIKVTEIKDVCNFNTDEYHLDFVSVSDENGKATWNDGTITFENPPEIAPGRSIYVTIKFKVTVNIVATKEQHDLSNTATVTSIVNKNNQSVSDSDGEGNNTDTDYLKTQTYAVSLEKYITGINGAELANRTTQSERAGYPEWSNDDSVKNMKKNNIVSVISGETVTYAIKVKNDGDTQVRNLKVIDTLPEGVTAFNVSSTKKYDASGAEMSNDINTSLNGTTLTLSGVLNPGESAVVYVTVKVTEPNMSLRILQNTAKIDDIIENRNDCGIYDTTPDNNQDSDYIQLGPEEPGNNGTDLAIRGFVWNDKAWNKSGNHYNGIYDDRGDTQESTLDGIDVYLYREGIDKTIAMKTTADGGKYEFTATDIDEVAVRNAYERHIKGPYKEDGSGWAGTYYSYYVVFEYDGVTYTSTEFFDVMTEDENNSNAREDNGKVKETRTNFNNRFATINNGACVKGIDNDDMYSIGYGTVNADEYIPQSNHIYNKDTMAMQSSTNIIELSNDDGIIDNLQHVNLGLRGRDVFDLELKSTVNKIEVTVNGQKGVYTGTNKATIRKSDTANYKEDMKNTLGEKNTDDGGNQQNFVQEGDTQAVRTTDMKVGNTGSGENGTTPYDDDQLLQSIFVTYKITVTNASQTEGTATKIIDYYDDKYSVAGVYSDDNMTNELPRSDVGAVDGAKAIEITTQGTKLSQGASMDIYVRLELDNAKATINSISTDSKLATYNMAEISVYKTFTTENPDGTDNEATRGLIDKDSAPGSANTEYARLRDGLTSDKTTVQYYFNKTNLDKLKYEDDTYATPTLYFTTEVKNRTLSGTVFRDATKLVDGEDGNPMKVRTGDGYYNKDEANGEVGVYGATVELVEVDSSISASTDPATIGDGDDVGTVRYTTTTAKDGTFKFTNYLPGYYILRYRYGDTVNTVLLNKADDVNKYSYNGEDYQSTNNTGEAYSYNEGIGKLNSTQDTWYAFNKNDKVSTATDNSGRRSTVSGNVMAYTGTIDQLNKARNGEVFDISENDFKNKTQMFATTPRFVLTVEETVTDDSNTSATQNTSFKDYNVTNMNFGIAEVPVATIDIQKYVYSFRITDSTGKNVIAEAELKNPDKPSDGWKLKGDVLPGTDVLDVSAEDEKLQGARLQVTYMMTATRTTERNFRNENTTTAKIKGIVDFIHNGVSYNKDLEIPVTDAAGNKLTNDAYWTILPYDDATADSLTGRFKAVATEIGIPEGGTTPQGTVDPDGKKYSTIVAAKSGNPLLIDSDTTAGNIATSYITLEKVLSATDTTIEDIITSTADISEYFNTIEITGFTYTDGDGNDSSDPYRDRIRRKDRYIIIPGVTYDSATSETITIHPPTGDSGISITYYIMAVVALAVLGVGVFGIKKYVIDKKK